MADCLEERDGPCLGRGSPVSVVLTEGFPDAGKARLWGGAQTLPSGVWPGCQQPGVPICETGAVPVAFQVPGLRAQALEPHGQSGPSPDSLLSLCGLRQVT